MQVKHILSYLGVFLYVSGFLSLAPSLVAYLHDEPMTHYLISGGVMIIIGYSLSQLPRKGLSFGEAMLLSAFALLVLAFAGSITYLMTTEGPLLRVFVDGFFESVSGITTTGFTILSDEKLDPTSPLYSHSLVFNRALRQWIGGLGIIVLTLSILAGGGISTVYLYKVGEGIERITPTVEHTTRIITRIYVFFTLSGFILLWISGMNLENSLNASLSLVSTGGFSYSSRGLHAGNLSGTVMILLMLAGSIPFTLHYNLMKGRVRSFLQNIEVKTLLAITSLVAVIVFAMYLPEMSATQALKSAVFNTVSVVSTTGYSLTPLSHWNSAKDGVKMIYTLLMLVGGSAGSTAGGLKIIRLIILLSGLKWMIRRAMLPKTAVLPLKVGKHVFSEQELSTVALYFALFIIVLSLSSIVYMNFGINLDGGGVPAVDAIFLSTSALSNASPTTVSIIAQPLIVKITLIIEMILGRLEIFPIIALIAYGIERIEKTRNN